MLALLTATNNRWTFSRLCAQFGCPRAPCQTESPFWNVCNQCTLHLCIRNWAKALSTWILPCYFLTFNKIRSGFSLLSRRTRSDPCCWQSCNLAVHTPPVCIECLGLWITLRQRNWYGNGNSRTRLPNLQDVFSDPEADLVKFGLSNSILQRQDERWAVACFWNGLSLKAARDSLGRRECANFFLSKLIVYGATIRKKKKYSKGVTMLDLSENQQNFASFDLVKYWVNEKVLSCWVVIWI